VPHLVAIGATPTEIAHGNSRKVTTSRVSPRAVKRVGNNRSRDRDDGIPLKQTQLNKLVMIAQENDERYDQSSIIDS
jgi:hypothetical protein